jgi:hypothetical protein
MLHLFAIREAAGELKISKLEPYFEDGLVAGMADVDRCLTQAYDRRLANEDVKPLLETCRMAELHQYVLDCGATFINELYKLTRLSFLPFTREREEMRASAEEKIRKECVRSDASPAAATPPAAAAPPVTSGAPAPSAK